MTTVFPVANGKSTSCDTSSPSTWKDALVTADDKFHLHKVAGILCLGSMAFRFYCAAASSVHWRINASDMGFLSHPQLSWLTLALHTALPLSSFQFRIPARRIKDGGRIWPEYRLHAAVFSLRSIVLIALYQWEKQHARQPNYICNYFILMGGMLAADASSWWVGRPFQSQSVRGLDTHPAVQGFFSFMQFNTSAGLLYGLRRCTLPFLVIFVVQTTPFVATLRRKSIAIYGSMLLISAVLVQMDFFHTAGIKTVLVIRTVGQWAFLQRTTPLGRVESTPTKMTIWVMLLRRGHAVLQNKYVVWTCLFMVVRKVRQNLDTIPLMWIQGIWLLTLIFCVVLVYCKARLELNSRSTTRCRASDQFDRNIHVPEIATKMKAV